MNDLNRLIDRLALDTAIKEEDIPEIDLYMDQVIQLFDAKYGTTIRSDEDKVLTKTMINNYAKGKLFVPIKNKKYSKQHIMLINLIYHLKGSLSISDVKETLSPLKEKMASDEFTLNNFYQYFISLQQNNKQVFLKEIQDLDKLTKELEAEDELQKLLLISSLANMSNFYRRAAELLVDELAPKEKEKK
ncbi:DUF1836 domain-containing protein [Psychrobacillus sp. MER TA 171]|uniref:DUF1836 domain-containing protein n=1 Tax=Psychrobacillus sp. MER TA 171 TaxID=2939577 RepID=UPI00203B6CB5|nr:DUF1836 domain-containing protein [Psychrobacillus sp. MER TA 171]MCM3359155.1 DUF1836 domain-containing protein [Psychrobacillus sp. MER TA 171]